jgi:hypothetical protein
MNNVRDDSKFSNQCVSIFNRGTLVLFLCKCGTNVLLRLSIKCNPKKYEITNQFEKYKGIKNRDVCGNAKCQCA